MARLISVVLACAACFWVTLSQAGEAAADNSPWHHVEIGFNLGYPDRVMFQEQALGEIERIGIRHVRIYEVFDGKPGNGYQQRLKGALDGVLRHGMTPLLGISNVPAELLPAENERQRQLELLPDRVAGKTKNILGYSNRFPPVRLDQYQQKLQGLIDFLVSTYGKEKVASWWFEIGNEPDAPLYFWGTAEQFRQMSQAAVELLQRNGIYRIGGFGVTHHAVFLDDRRERSAQYGALLEGWFRHRAQGGFTSFHLYERDDEATSPLANLPAWLSGAKERVMLTEWNVSSRGEEAEKIFDKPGAWGAEFLRLLVDCAAHGIDRIYLFGLMDNALHNTLQLGAFDRTGKPKSWYRDFEALWNVVRDGYQIDEHNGVLTVAGTNGQYVAIAVERPLRIVPTDVVYLPQSLSMNPQMLSKDQWVVLSSKQALSAKP